MPEGNHHLTPPGLWYQEPTTSSVPRLFAKSAGKLAALFGVMFMFDRFRSLYWKYTYTRYIGKTMSLGNLTILTHESLSVEEIDRLKVADAEKRRLTQGS